MSSATNPTVDKMMEKRSQEEERESRKSLKRNQMLQRHDPPTHHQD